MSKLKIGSLFAGIGGFDLGLERTGGFETAWFCEIEEYPTKILNQWWPDTPVYPDVTKLKGDEVEPVDILVGGFPCQDISAAGRGAGIGGDRSSLWFEFARLVGELRPRYVIAENSPLLKTRGLNAVLGSLAEVGYDAEWDCVPARTFGAPHQRDRIWVVAYPNGACDEGDGRPVGDEAEVSGPGDPRSDGEPRLGVSDPGESRRETTKPDVHGRERHLARSDIEGRTAVADPDNGAGTPERWEREDAAEEGSGGRVVAGGGEVDAEWEGPAGSAGETSGSLRHLADPCGVAEREPGHEAEALPSSREARQNFGGRGERVDPSRGWGWAPEPDVGRVANGVPSRVDRLSALGNALVPVIPEWIGYRILEWEESRARG